MFKIAPIQPISSSSELFNNLGFDGNEVYSTKSGKTVADVGSTTFSEILKEAREHEHRGNQEGTY